MTTFIGIVLGLLKAIPILDGWFQALMSEYVKDRIDGMKSGNLAAIRKALVEHDQRDLEKAIGSPTAGLPSGDAGSVIQPGPPPNA